MLSRIRSFLGRPVAWGAVLLSYVGVIGTVAYTASTAADNSDAVGRESERADRRIEQVIAQVDRAREKQQQQFCGVSSREHQAAKMAVGAERRRLLGTMAYLRDVEKEIDSGADIDSTALVDRVRANVPNIKRDLKQARLNVEATRPPSVCKVYLKEK